MQPPSSWSLGIRNYITKTQIEIKAPTNVKAQVEGYNGLKQMPQIYNQIENSNQLRDQGKIKVYSRYTLVQEPLPDVGVSIKRCSDHYTAESNIHSSDHAGRNSQRENKKNRIRVLICNSNWKYLRTPSPCSIIYTPSWG